MANEVLGHASCPLCGAPHQEVRLSEKSKKPYMNCDECGCQVFARQPRSVKLMREMVGAGQIEKKPVEETQQAKPVAQMVEQEELEKGNLDAMPRLDTIPRRPEEKAFDSWMWGDGK